MEQLPIQKQQHQDQLKGKVKSDKIESQLHSPPQIKQSTLQNNQLIKPKIQLEKPKVIIKQIPEKSEIIQLTKRSDEQQFVNWQISTVKSGKFCFIQKKQSLSSVGKLNDIDDQEKTQKSVKKNKKLIKSVSCHKKFIQENFIEQFRQILISSKLIKVVFTHFCKESHLVSIKSTLFEEKQKQGEQMTLNKWMVFCKEFQILIKLCRLKYMSRKSQIVQENQLSNSQVREFFQTKEAKEVEQKLTKIFKKVSKNQQKMTYDGFVQGLMQIYQEFDPVYLRQEKGIKEFLNEVMHCAQQKTCFKKLSSLTLTAATPKIQYNKANFRNGQVKSRVKSRAGNDKTKQNSRDNTSKSFNKAKSSASYKNFQKLNMNPIIRYAKRILKECETNKNEFINVSKSTHKLKLTKDKKLQGKGKGQSELIKYFESTKDAILDSYFMHQKNKQILKKGRL